MTIFSRFNICIALKKSCRSSHIFNAYSWFNPFSFVIRSSCLCIFLGSLYCKQYGPRSHCFQWSSLIRVHSICFHDKIKSEVKGGSSISGKGVQMFRGSIC